VDHAAEVTPGGAAAIVRPRACLAGVAATLLGCYLATGSVLVGGARQAAAAVAIGCVIGFANVVNDLADIAVDTVGSRHRPLPSGRFTVAGARALAAVLAIVAVACAAALGPWMAAWMLLLVAVCAVYSAWLKNTVLVGNTVVAACAGMPIVYGAAAAGRVTTVVWAGYALVVMFMFGYEVLKTVADQHGDAALGLRTVATRWGERRSIRVYAVVVAALTVIVAGASQVSGRPALYLASAALTYLLPSWYIVWRLRSTHAADLMWVLRRAWLAGLVTLWLLR
jgi:geranylgeranylglycerol-phosphate geranylgeranyltransferase